MPSLVSVLSSIHSLLPKHWHHSETPLGPHQGDQTGLGASLCSLGQQLAQRCSNRIGCCARLKSIVPDWVFNWGMRIPFLSLSLLCLKDSNTLYKRRRGFDGSLVRQVELKATCKTSIVNMNIYIYIERERVIYIYIYIFLCWRDITGIEIYGRIYHRILKDQGWFAKLPIQVLRFRPGDVVCPAVLARAGWSLSSKHINLLGSQDSLKWKLGPRLSTTCSWSHLRSSSEE